MVVSLKMKHRPAAVPVILLTAIFLTMLAGGCAGNGGAAGAGSDGAAGGGHGDAELLFPKLPKVSGQIAGVTADPDNPRYFSLLRLADADGQHWEFHADGWVGVSAGHLREHRIQGTPVTVAYERRADGTLVARFVGD